VDRLGPADYEGLSRLYADGDSADEAPPFFDAAMLRNGVYFGIREGGILIAAAGTHVLAPDEGVAGIGNVYVRRDRRGHGLGRSVTAAVTGELLQLGLRTVGLNVEESNVTAIRVYERLGFRRSCEYREGIAIYRGAKARSADTAACRDRAEP
jgi:predicted GNAT family acetyltransferase